MATSHDNFFVTNLIDRTSLQSGRVRDVINGTISSRIEFTGDAETKDIGNAKIYAFTGAVATTLVLNLETLALGSEDAPYFVAVIDESGNASTNNITINFDGSFVNESSAQVGINIDYGFRYFYSNGDQWFQYSRNS